MPQIPFHISRIKKVWAVVLFVCGLIEASPLLAQRQETKAESCPRQKIEVVRLPDLNIARAGNCAFFVDGEVVLVGGHTDGFIPTATAEYLKDGEWHLMKTAYEHDNGLGLVLNSGKVLIAGGHEKSLGIGQTFPTEYYNPADHSFEGFGCLDKKRALAQALQLDDGRVVIAGNWYHTDGIEVFDGKAFSLVHDIDSGMVRPYIFQTATDDAVILGDQDNYGKRRKQNLVYRLKGEPFSVPLFEEWHPYVLLEGKDASESFIGDRQKGVYAYLFLVQNDSGQMGIARMKSAKGQEVPEFSLLTAKYAVPMKGQSGKQIYYFSGVMADQQKGRGYVTGFDKDGRFYVLCINNVRAEKDVDITLYYTDPLEDLGYGVPVLTDDGNIIIAGGITDSNFYPKASAYVLCLNDEGASHAGSSGRFLWLMMTLLLPAGILACVFIFGKKRPVPTEDNPEPLLPEADEGERQLFQSICALMDAEKTYLRSDLKLSDVSSMLSTNSRYVSEAIKSQRDCSFTQFVNGYRVEHAKRLMRENPDRKITEIAVLSGFSGESSFFRTFKTFTGLTPKEWIAQNQSVE